MVKRNFNYVQPQTEEKIKEILTAINPNNEPEDKIYSGFTKYILFKDHGNPHFEKGIQLIQTFMKEMPDDYIGLLYCYAVLKDYYLYESGCIWAEFLVHHLSDDNSVNLDLTDESLHGSTFFHANRILEKKGISLTLKVHFNTSEDSLYKWQLSLLPQCHVDQACHYSITSKALLKHH